MNQVLEWVSQYESNNVLETTDKPISELSHDADDHLLDSYSKTVTTAA